MLLRVDYTGKSSNQFHRDCLMPGEARELCQQFSNGEPLRATHPIVIP